MDGESDSVGSSEANLPENHTCRFCHKTFSKSQALGGHMNGHRQEIENEKYEKAKALLQRNSWMINNQRVGPQNYASIPRGVQNVGGGISGVGPSLPQAGYPSSLSTYSNQNVGGVNSRVGPSLPRSGYPSSLSKYSNQNLGGVNSGVGSSLPQSGYPSSLSKYSKQNLGGVISGVGPSLPTSYLNQQQQDHINYRMRERYPYHPNHQMRKTYPSIPYQTKNNLQIGGGASLVKNSGIGGASLPMNSHLRIRGPSFPTLQGGNPNLVVSGYPAAVSEEQKQKAIHQQDHINYRMRERYPYHPNHQMRKTYPSIPYQTKNNLQIGGGASLVKNSGIGGASLPMNSHVRIRGPSFPTLQGGNPNLVASASEGHHSSAPSSTTQESDELIPEEKTTVRSERM